jgi:high-affinity nickel permease
MLSGLAVSLLAPSARPWVMTSLAMAACVAVYWWGYDHARDAAHVAHIEQQLEQRETRDEVEAVVAREPDPAARLLNSWARD